MNQFGDFLREESQKIMDAGIEINREEIELVREGLALMDKLIKEEGMDIGDCINRMKREHYKAYVAMGIFQNKSKKAMMLGRN